MDISMIERNDFGSRILARYDKKMCAIELDDYTAEVEVKIINGILDGLLKLEKLTQGEKDERAGSEIEKYRPAFDRRGDGVHSGAADAGTAAAVGRQLSDDEWMDLPADDTRP